jgi:hypothetical protein
VFITAFLTITIIVEMTHLGAITYTMRFSYVQ